LEHNLEALAEVRSTRVLLLIRYPLLLEVVPALVYVLDRLGWEWMFLTINKSASFDLKGACDFSAP